MDDELLRIGIPGNKKINEISFPTTNFMPLVLVLPPGVTQNQFDSSYLQQLVTSLHCFYISSTVPHKIGFEFFF